MRSTKYVIRLRECAGKFESSLGEHARPRGYKTFFMLNSAEHEIYPANKSQITKKIANSFLLNITEHENFSANKYENANYCWHFHIYQKRKFHAQLS